MHNVITSLSCAADEWQAYIDIAARESLSENVTSFWRSVENRLPKLTASAKAVDIYNCMADLLSWLHNPGFPYATPGCEYAMTNAAEKLSEYLEGTKQPAIQLFRAVRVFDPKQLPLLSHTFSEYT